MTNLDGTPSDPEWDLDGRGSDPGEGLDGTPRDSNRRLGPSDFQRQGRFSSSTSCCRKIGNNIPTASISSKSAVKQRDRGREGRPEIIQKFRLRSCRFPYDSYERDRAPFCLVLGEEFWGNIRYTTTVGGENRQGHFHPPSQHQWCIKFLGPWEEEFYTPLALRVKI